MFDFVRKHMKWMQLILFLLIVPSFVLFGLEGYNRFQEKGEAVARVDGHDISREEWENAHKQEVDRLRAQMPNLDAKLFDSPEARYGTLERIVRDRVLAAAANKSHLTVSDARVAREIQQDPTIAQLRGPDGKLDMARYRQLLGAQGMTPEAFENKVRSDLATNQVLWGLGGSGLSSAAVTNATFGAFYEKREIQLANFAAADFTSKVAVTDADIEAFYKANAPMFQAPEQASIEYVVLDLEAVTKGITVNEQDLKTYYEQNAQRMAGQEERRASHILISVPKNAAAADREKAKAKAQELLAAAKKNPEAFADLARKNSQDTGSAQQGGDLDFFARGAMVKPFEDAAFSMQKGAVSELVESEFGYHIIKLTDIKAPKQRTFEEMRPQLEADLKRQQAQKRFAEAAESFTNTVYEQSESLKPVADKLKLEVKTAAGLSRTPARGAAGPLANPKFLTALFSADAIEKKRNTEAVEVGPSQLASGRIVQYTPARTRPLAEVKDEVRTRLVAQRASEMAKKEGEAKLAAWKAAPTSAQLGAPVVVSRADGQKQVQQVVEAALRADPAALPAFVGVDLGAGGYTVVKVNKSLPREQPPADVAKQEATQYMRTWANAESLAYYELLRERFKAQIKVPKPSGPTPLQ
jgi:peptidyl-prolyl cis-trans isomerase D